MYYICVSAGRHRDGDERKTSASSAAFPGSSLGVRGRGHVNNIYGKAANGRRRLSGMMKNKKKKMIIGTSRQSVHFTSNKRFTRL